MTSFSQGRVPVTNAKPLLQDMKKVQVIGPISIYKEEKSRKFWCVKGTAILNGPTALKSAIAWADGFKKGQAWK